MSYFLYYSRAEGVPEIANLFGRYLNNPVSYRSKVRLKDLFQKHTFFCYPKFDVAFTRKHNPEINAFIKRGFCGKIVDWKSFLRNVYYYGLILFFPFSAAGVIRFENNVDNENNVMLFPNNKKIKIVDFSSRIVTNIHKEKYDTEWYRKEVSFRSEMDLPYVIPVKALSESVYEEPFITAYTLARVDRKSRLIMTDKVFSILAQLSKVDHKTLFISEYSQQLLKLYHTKIQKLAGRIDESEINILFLTLVESLLESSSFIETGLSHGDVQRGNILLDTNGNVYLIDWETYDIRSTYYDLLVFQYGLKNKAIQFDLIKRSLKADQLELRNVAEGIVSGTALKNMWKVYLLEDILLLLEETLMLPNGEADGLRYYEKSNCEQYMKLFDIDLKENGEIA